MIQGLVSVIVPTRNSEKYIERTLQSIKAQTYPDIEVIVVDNYSTDHTAEIARKYAETIYLCGPERVAQLAFGYKKASGEFWIHHTADLVMPPTAVEEAVSLLEGGYDGVEIGWLPDVSAGFWAKVRLTEMLCYITGQETFGANVMRVATFEKAGGYDTRVTVAGDDYQIRLALRRMGARCTRTKAVMTHMGEPHSLAEIARKDIYYGTTLKAFFDAKGNEGVKEFLPPLARYWRNRNILIGSGAKVFFGFALYRCVRYLAAAVGFVTSTSWAQVSQEPMA